MVLVTQNPHIYTRVYRVSCPDGTKIYPRL
jgi:hypothetical protein